MGNKLKYILLLLLGFTTLKGQVNLVPNGSFEEYYYCPGVTSIYGATFNNLKYCGVGWYNTKGSVDLFTNNNISDITDGCMGQGERWATPPTVFGFQYPRTDSTFIGLITWSYTILNPFEGHNYHSREWAGIRLADSLKKDNCYTFKMHVSRGENTGYNVSCLGAYFSKDSLFTNTINGQFISPFPMPLDSVQVQQDPLVPIWDTTWVPITGIFKAKGGEKYLYIGNLLKDEEYTPIGIGTYPDSMYCKSSYFFIDDVSLFEIDEPCGVGINEIKAGQLKLYPNPTTTNATFEYSLNTKSSVTITLMDATGKVVERISPGTQNAGTYKQTIATENYPAGLYLVQLQAGGSSISKRLQVVK